MIWKSHVGTLLAKMKKLIQVIFFAIEQPANARYYKDMHQSEKHNMEKGGKKK